MTTAATIFVEAAIGMAVGGLCAVGSMRQGLYLWPDGHGWLADRFTWKRRLVPFRVTTSHTENVATEVQRMPTGMKIGRNISAFRWQE